MPAFRAPFVVWFLCAVVCIASTSCAETGPVRVQSVEVTPTNAAFAAIGDTARFSAVVMDSRGHIMEDQGVVWTSSNAAIVGVDADGLTTAKANGTALIIAAASEVADTVSVVVEQVVASLLVGPANAAVGVGTSIQMSATATDANGNTASQVGIVWTSSDPAIASVAPDGKVTTLAIGSVSITATIGAQSASTVVTVERSASGYFASDTTWSPSGGPVHVTGNILVPAGVTLTIAPGTTVVFDGLFYLKVQGKLVAIGTPSDSIRFTSFNQQRGSRILFSSSSATYDGSGSYVSGSAISHAVISYGPAVVMDYSSVYFANNHVHHVVDYYFYGALSIAHGTPVIRGNIIEDNPVTGIYVLNAGGSPRIERNVIRRNTANGGGGLNIDSSDPDEGVVVVEDNRITNNTARYGAGLVVDGSVMVRYNEITDNVTSGSGTGGAVYVGTVTGEISYNNIENNSSSGAQSAAIVFAGSFFAPLRNNNFGNPLTFEAYVGGGNHEIDAGSNFWNTTSTAALDAKIWDFKDNFEVPRVNYTPILTARVASAGIRP